MKTNHTHSDAKELKRGQENKAGTAAVGSADERSDSKFSQVLHEAFDLKEE